MIRNECLFCSIINHPELHSKPEDELIDETETLVAKPGLGHFVDGYTLVLSRNHYPSFAASGEQLLRELELFKCNVAARLKAIYQRPVIAFEHGAEYPGYRAGCCIDHAHLHLLPLDFDIFEGLQQRFQCETLDSYRELIRYHQGSRSYIFYEGTDGQKFGFIIDRPIKGQFVRRLICERLQQPRVWDWELFPYRERIVTFKSEYARACNLGLQPETIVEELSGPFRANSG